MSRLSSPVLMAAWSMPGSSLPRTYSLRAHPGNADATTRAARRIEPPARDARRGKNGVLMREKEYHGLRGGRVRAKRVDLALYRGAPSSRVRARTPRNGLRPLMVSVPAPPSSDASSAFGGWSSANLVPRLAVGILVGS